MSNTHTAQNITFPKENVIPATGTWQARGYQFGFRVPSFPQGPVRDSFVALVLAISPLTFGADPWFLARRKDLTVSRQIASQPVGRRRITLLQARNIALGILRTAEQERSRLADAEASVRAIWEVEP